MNTLPFAQLQLFAAVARHRSFSRAARELALTRSALSQAVRQLEEQLGVSLLTRTTRSVALTPAGAQLLGRVSPAFAEVTDALRAVTAQPGALVGRLRLSVPRSAVPYAITPILPVFCALHPGVEVEVSIDERLVDIVAEGYDAGVRLIESIARDMLQVRLSAPFRFVVVASPGYLAACGAPERPEDLAAHTCVPFRMKSTQTLYAWEFERGARSWRVPVRGPAVTDDVGASVALAEAGLGLAYTPEHAVEEALAAGRLVRVLEAYAPSVPGYFLYFPESGRASPTLRAFIEVVRAEVASRRGAG